MSPVRLTFAGFDDLRATLRRLPEDLRDEARDLVQAEGERAGDEIRAAYERHRVTGNLAAGVVVEAFARERFGAAVRVASKAKHAFIFENGTEVRRTKRGWPRGKMWTRQAGVPVFVPAMLRARKRLREGLRALLTRAGLTVTG